MRIIAWLSAGLTVFIILLFVTSYFIDEPLRRYMVKSMNRSLKGYKASIQSLDFHPVGLSVTLRDLQITQQAYPDPPVADIPYLHASVHWAEIIHARLVGDFELRGPRVHINLKQLEKEASDEEPVEDRGWQGAVQSIYPLKINILTIRNGDFVYIDQDPDRPLRLGDIFFQANNIRNIVSPERNYPSPVYMESSIFGKGHAKIEGDADFLLSPYPGIDARVELKDVPLGYLKPVAERYGFVISGGELSAAGTIENAPKKKAYSFKTVEVKGVKVDYLIPGPPEEKKEAGKKVVKEATKTQPGETGEEEIFYLIENLRVTGDFGMVNTTTDPNYRVYLDNADLRVKRLSNGFRQGEAKVRLDGDFMGSGKTDATAAFRAEESGPDFDLNLRINGTALRSMNDLFRAYGNFDVAGGTFSLYTEIRVKNDRIDGYVKPFFKDLDVYDRRQDKEKSIFREMYEGLVGGVTGLLENKPRQQVATRTKIAGKVENPKTSTWQIVGNLFRNAFFRAVLPRFDQDVGEIRR